MISLFHFIAIFGLLSAPVAIVVLIDRRLRGR